MQREQVNEGHERQETLDPGCVHSVCVKSAASEQTDLYGRIFPETAPQCRVRPFCVAWSFGHTKSELRPRQHGNLQTQKQEIQTSIYEDVWRGSGSGYQSRLFASSSATAQSWFLLLSALLRVNLISLPAGAR